jgi:hypothetical protein
VEVEDITRVSLTSRRSSKQKRHLSVSDGLLGKIVVDDEGMTAVVTEPFTHGASRERSKILQGSSLGSGSGNDDRVLEGIVVLKGLRKLSDSRSLLSNGDVDTVELLLLITTTVDALLVQNSVNGNGGLTCLTVTNDKLSLTTANGNKSIHSLETSLHGFVDRATGKDTRSLEVGPATLLGVDGSTAIDGVTKGIDDTAKKLGSDRNVDNGTGTLDSLTLLDKTIVTEQYNTDLAGFQVKGHTLDA